MDHLERPLPPRSHTWMAAISAATFVAWLLASGQGYKTLVLIATMLVTVIVLITCAAHVFGFKARPLVIIVAATLALGSCVGQCSLNMRDHGRVIEEMRGLTCTEARRIRDTNVGIGRTWKKTREDYWEGVAVGPTRYWDLYLVLKPGESYYMQPSGMGDDMGSAMVFCGPGSDSQLPDVRSGPRGP